MTKQLSSLSPLQPAPTGTPARSFPDSLRVTSFIIPGCCNVMDDSWSGGLGEEKAAEEDKMKQEMQSGKLLSSVFPSQLLSCGMKHLHIMSHATQALPSVPLPTDLGNSQACPLPQQETSPKLVSILTHSKQKLRGDKGAHTDTAWWCFNTQLRQA